MNQLENCQARYRSNTWMGRTHTDGPDEFEPLKFDCIILRIRILTFKTPNNQRVGSTPTENIKRSMIEAMRVIMLDGVAMVMTRARDANIQVQTSPDRRGSNSEM